MTEAKTKDDKQDPKPEPETEVDTPKEPEAKPIDIAPMRPIDKGNPKGVRQINRDVLAKNLKRADTLALRQACTVLEIPVTGKDDVLRRRIVMKQCGGKMEYIASGTICASCFNVVAITHTEEKYRRYKCTSCGRRGEIWNE